MGSHSILDKFASKIILLGWLQFFLKTPCDNLLAPNSFQKFATIFTLIVVPFNFLLRGYKIYTGDSIEVSDNLLPMEIAEIKKLLLNFKNIGIVQPVQRLDIAAAASALTSNFSKSATRVIKKHRIAVKRSISTRRSAKETMRHLKN